MNFKWAIERLRKGEKVRRPCWKEESSWMIGVDEIIYWEEGIKATVHLIQIEATDWEIYKEPKINLKSATIKELLTAIMTRYKENKQ